MKWAVGVLVLMNALVLLYFNAQSGQNSAHVALQQISPEKIRLYTPEEAAALPRKQNAVTTPQDGQPAQQACYEWSSLPSTAVERARNVLDKMNVAYGVREEAPAAISGNQRFWVYIPPAASVQLAQAKMRELSALGVTDSYLVQEAPWRNAISLGIFKDEQLANRHLEDLRRVGVRSAVKGVRGAEAGQSVLVMQDLGADVAAEVQKASADFAGSEFKQVNCQ